MLSGVNVAIVGGDARQLEVIRKFIKCKATVYLIGFDHLDEEKDGVRGAIKTELSGEVLKRIDALILPIVGTDDEGNIESIFCSRSLNLSENDISYLPKHAIIYTGMSRPYLRQLVDNTGLRLQEILNRDDVAIYNSIPTAEGAVMMAIQNTDFTIHGSRCAVLGFGRTGMTMARTLQGMGAKVKVGARRPAHIARITEMGFTPFTMDEMIYHVSDLDLVFNTIPAKVITKEVIEELPRWAVIIDLASSPGGTDFQYAEKKGIKALLAPGLPGIVAPKTAGQILADTLSRLVKEQMGNQEE